jgi:Omp85 superfamily domain
VRGPLLLTALLYAALLRATPALADGLSAADLARKNERGYVTGLPLVAYSTDIGLGGGARAYYYWNGARDDPRFAQTPYLQRVFVQAFATTRGIQFHWLDYDAPRLFASPYRVRAALIFGRNINSNYFGVGEAGRAPLRFPGQDRTFDSFAAYERAQRGVFDGVTYAKYNVFDQTRPALIASVERLLASDRVRLLAGYGFTYAIVDDYTGEQVDARDAADRAVKAPSAPTLLRQDCEAGRLVGCGGGREGLLRLGVSYDTRDFEPDPNRGVFAELAVDAAATALGSEYQYLRVLASARGYVSPTPRRADLVLAGRAFAQWQSAGTPFFTLNTLPFTDDVRAGLGGHRTLRGFRQDRFIGRAVAALNGEVRWTFARFALAGQRFAAIAVPFVDAGRSFDDAGELTWRDFRWSGGGALRLSWNQATLLTVDYGVSAEDTGLYVNFGHMF